MITYSDKNGNIEVLNKEDLVAEKNSIYFTSLYTAGGKFRCVDEFGDYTICILDIIDDKYVINAFDNWYVQEDIDDVLTIEQLVTFIIDGGY
jgi:hypothetical protein